MNLGDCFKVESSFGDDRPSWFVYRCVRAIIGDTVNGSVCCYRFEIRSDGSYVWVPQDVIATRMLAQQTSMVLAEYLTQFNDFMKSVRVTSQRITVDKSVGEI